MGNQLSRPVTKERPMALIRRKLGLMTRKDQIDRLLNLTLLNDEVKLRKFAAKANLTGYELSIYYEKLSEVLGEFCTDVPEVEYRHGTATPTEKDETSVAKSSSCSSNSSQSAMSPMYNDPSTQKKFEQFCMTQYGKKVNVKTVECTHADEKGIERTDGHLESNAPIQKRSLKQNIVGDGELLAAKKIMLPGKHQDDGDTLTFANPTGPRGLNICMQITAVETSLVQHDPAFANPTGQKGLNICLQTTALGTSFVQHDPVGANPNVPLGLNSCMQTPAVEKLIVQQEPPFANPTGPCGEDTTKFSSPSKQRVLHTPVMQTPAVEKSLIQQDPACAIPTGPQGLNTCLPTSAMPSSAVENSIAQHDPTLANPTGPCEEDSTVLSQAISKEDEIPKFSSPSKQRVLHSPVMQTPAVEKSLLQQDPACPDPTGPRGLNTCMSTPAVEKSIVQHDPTLANPTGPCGEDSTVLSQDISKEDEIPKFSSPSKQRVLHTPVMQTPAVEKSIIQQDPACANPTGPRGLITCIPTLAVEKSLIQQDPASANPSGPQSLNTCMPTHVVKKSIVKDKPTSANPTGPCGEDSTVLSQAISKEDEIPKFSSPSKQRVLHTPVMLTHAVEKSIVQQNPTLANPTGPCGGDSTVLAQATSKETEIPKISKHGVLNTPEVIKRPSIPCDSEVPVFLCPSQQPVTHSPVQSGKMLQPPMLDLTQVFANVPLPDGLDPRTLSPETLSLLLDLMNIKPTEQPGEVHDVSSPVLCKPALVKPDQVMDISIGHGGISTSAALQMGKPVKNVVALDIPFSNPSMQRVQHSPVMIQQPVNTTYVEAPVFQSQSKQPVLFTPVFTKPTGRPLYRNVASQTLSERELAKHGKLIDISKGQNEVSIPAFANPPWPPGFTKSTRRPVYKNASSQTRYKQASGKPDQVMDNSLGHAGISTSAALQMRKPVKNAVALEIPVSSNPSRQPIVHTPVVIKPPVKATDVDAPEFKSPSKQPVVFSPVFAKPAGRPGLDNGATSQALYEQASVKQDKVVDISIGQNGESTSKELKKRKPVKNVDVLEIPLSDKSMQQVVPQSAVIKPPVNTTDLEAPMFTSPSKQPVVFSPVPQLQFPVSHDKEKMPGCSSMQPVVLSPVIQPPAKTSDFEVPLITSPSKQPVIFSPVPPLRLPVSEETEKMPMCPSRQPVVFSPVMIEPPVNTTDLEDPVFTSPSKQPVLFSPVPPLRPPVSQEKENMPMCPSRQPVVFSPVMIEPPVNTTDLEDPVFTSPSKQPVLFSPVQQLQLPVSPDNGVMPVFQNEAEQSGTLMSASAESPGVASPTRPKSKMLGKIGAGLLTRSKVTPKANSKSHKSVSADKSAQKTVAKEAPVTETASKKLKGVKNDTEKKSGKGKAGLIRRCVDSIKRRTESALSNHKVIKVKPATPDCAVKNIIKHSARPKPVAKKVIPQPNMRPDKGIVWPLEFEGLSCHNKAYYVEQFLRSELFKQRCTRKRKGGNTWMNGLSEFQLWVVEHEGSDAIDTVLNPVPKTKNDAKAKVRCWRGDTPDLFLV